MPVPFGKWVKSWDGFRIGLGRFSDGLKARRHIPLCGKDLCGGLEDGFLELGIGFHCVCFVVLKAGL